jgi:hypothetical protein
MKGIETVSNAYGISHALNSTVLDLYFRAMPVHVFYEMPINRVRDALITWLVTVLALEDGVLGMKYPKEEEDKIIQRCFEAIEMKDIDPILRYYNLNRGGTVKDYSKHRVWFINHALRQPDTILSHEKKREIAKYIDVEGIPLLDRDALKELFFLYPRSVPVLNRAEDLFSHLERFLPIGGSRDSRVIRALFMLQLPQILWYNMNNDFIPIIKDLEDIKIAFKNYTEKVEHHIWTPSDLSPLLDYQDFWYDQRWYTPEFSDRCTLISSMVSDIAVNDLAPHITYFTELWNCPFFIAHDRVGKCWG